MRSTLDFLLHDWLQVESLTATGVASVIRDHQVVNQLDNAAKGVKVTDARGIPPRGGPV